MIMISRDGSGRGRHTGERVACSHAYASRVRLRRVRVCACSRTRVCAHMHAARVRLRRVCASARGTCAPAARVRLRRARGCACGACAPATAACAPAPATAACAPAPAVRVRRRSVFASSDRGVWCVCARVACAPVTAAYARAPAACVRLQRVCARDVGACTCSTAARECLQCVCACGACVPAARVRLRYMCVCSSCCLYALPAGLSDDTRHMYTRAVSVALIGQRLSCNRASSHSFSPVHLHDVRNGEKRWIASCCACACACW